MSMQTLTDFDSAPFEIIDGDRGKNYPKQHEFSDSGYCMFLSATNVTCNGFDFSQCQFITEQKDNVLRKGKLERDDVVLTTRGTIGNTAFFNSLVSHDQMRINSGMVILRCNREEILPAYLYHFLRSPQFHGQVNSLRSGVAQPQLPIRDMRRIKMPLPKLSVQQRIAFILSAYDDLIENNRRRIQLLEESASLLYREWFVRFRFSGHEHVKIIDGMPEGWEKSTLGDNIVLNYGKSLKAHDRIEGTYPVYGSSGIVGTHKKPFARGPGIIVGRKGNVGSVFWSSKDFHPIDTVYYIDTESSDYYLYNALQHMQFVSSDAAVPGLNRNYAYSRPYLLPPETIRAHFENTVTPIYGQIFKLDNYNEKLKQARDILLPRLMNGEIAV